ncbi:Proteasome lid subunit RPN8/RPN11, contains Jab1/MPN metalloenzyme (JAMM) motif [Reichenbachiella faecimaris]|uniref:Proteasome lid subunit RPN8/RPN11, contains Jab1/MPN metalloenzyme (JAMM) motif n=1 Tax=Reichenbachiella faecimaris TaxID=692418 RepID=A0A1W2GQV2_REIFA|nr:M67 family metallopeptidase [Reichenbachiella faecimaris]SMD39055.1 Proteasome lid subunit RPN8/RPN11, contains Jab1/MPN metalloenzyme (JAMM) motif [Reichenbachiella faecimaris]
MKKQIQVSGDILEEMHRHALSDFPNECVGFFYGKSEGDIKTVTEYGPLENSKEGDQRRRFEVNPLDYMKAEKYALSNQLELLGIYHSHPLHPAIPSEHDLKQAVPFFSYIIASVNDTKVDKTTSWQLNEENQFEEELLKSN